MLWHGRCHAACMRLRRISRRLRLRLLWRRINRRLRLRLLWRRISRRLRLKLLWGRINRLITLLTRFVCTLDFGRKQIFPH